MNIKHMSMHTWIDNTLSVYSRRSNVIWPIDSSQNQIGRISGFVICIWIL